MRPLALITVFALVLAPAPALLGQDSPTVADRFAQVSSSVVTVKTASRQLRDGGMGVLAASAGVGSGVLIDNEGRIVTAAHVVQTADNLEVQFSDGETRKARVLASDRYTDLALIRVEGDLPSSAQPAVLGDIDTARVGDRIFIVGAPRGMSQTLTVGHLSAKRVEGSDQDGLTTPQIFQTDASMNPGNSGGPVFDMEGRVLGIVSFIVSKSGGDEGLGFAIGAKTVREVLLDRAPIWGGIEPLLLPSVMAGALNVPDGKTGVLVQRVAKGSLGASLGLRGGRIATKVEGKDVALGGDVILEIDGIEIKNQESINEVRRHFLSLKPGDTIRVKILRKGEILGLETEIPGQD